MVRRIARSFVPLSRPLAGTRWFRLWAVLHHTGRRSGRAYATPVVARPVADGFVIPMPFGDETQWARNLLAAGQGVLHWNGAEHPVVEPRVIEWEEAGPAFNRLQGAIIGRIGSRRFVRVRRA